MTTTTPTEENKIVHLHPTVLDSDDPQMGDAYIEKMQDILQEQDTGTNEAWTEEVKAFLDATTLKSLFFTEDWVYIICDLIASKISSQPLVIMRSQIGKDGKEVSEPFDAHPLNKVIANPNPWQEYHSWMYGYVVDLALLGNGVNWWAKNNRHIVPIPTEMVQMRFDSRGGLASYVITLGREDLAAMIQSTTAFLTSEIIHTRRPNPSSLLWGLSPFLPGRKSVLFNRYSTDYLNNFYVKQATPGMALEMDRQVNETQALRQLRSFEMAYAGRKNQRRTLILPKGVKATPMSHSIADQRLPDLINMNRETIINLLKVPKHEVGLQEAGSLGSEEYKTALRNFWEATLIPTMKLIEGSLTTFFANELGPNSYFKFDLSDVQALKDDQLKKAEIGKMMLQSGLTVNEVRTMLWEEQPSTDTDADKPYVLTKKPITSGGFPNPNSLSADGIETETTTAAVDALSPAMETQQISDTPKIVHPFVEKNGEWIAKVAKQLDDEVAGERGKAVEGFATEILLAMTETAIPIVKRTLVETKGKLSLKADLPSKKQLAKRLADAFANFSKDWTDEYIQTLSTSVDIGYGQEVELIFNKQAKDEVTALRARTESKTRAILEARGIDSFDSISKTHTDRIVGEVAKGVKANETIDQIAQRIADTFLSADDMLGKARTIARTETLTAVSIGQAAAVENAKEVMPGLKKAWLTANDERVRDTHTQAQDDGPIDVDEAFSNGLMFPRDPEADAPEEVINCRCTMIMIPSGEDIQLQSKPSETKGR